jgi:nitrogen fixation/metabolism regulation signal transduction histidine kinase
MMLALRTGVEARDAFRNSMVTLGWAAIAWIVIGILLVVAITWDVSHHIWRPIHALDRGVRQIADGNWSQPVPANTADSDCTMACCQAACSPGSPMTPPATSTTPSTRC